MAKVKSWTGAWINEPKVLGVFPRGDYHPHPPARTDRTIIPKEKECKGERMQSKGNAPTAAQKRWREAVRELGSVISGGQAVIHHPIGCGKNAKHNKVHIGHWWVIPLTDDEHKALHAGETFGFNNRKIAEKGWLYNIHNTLWNDCFEDTPPADVINAIMDYHR